MNLEKLKQAEALFLQRYPQGFLHPDMLALGKKHKMDKMIEMAQTSFAKSRFKDVKGVASAMVQIVSRSSMISVFEKPRFKDYVTSLDTNELLPLTEGLKDFIHGNQRQGFESMVNALKYAKLAKWSLITLIPNYFAPNDEVFLKPTTVKGVIKQFELEPLQYKPTPTWEFYDWYRQQIAAMKAEIIDTLKPNNAAFCGFLMMSNDG